MKLRNNVWGTVKAFLRSENYKYKLFLIYSLSLLFNGWFFGTVLMAPDSYSYISAIDTLLNGEPDVLRTPVYPLLLGMMRMIFPVSFVNIAVIFQYAVFFLSIFYFHKICVFFFRSPVFSFFTTLLYACHPYVALWSSYILTESLASSGLVFWLWFLIDYYQKRKYGALSGSLVVTFLLIFHRPSFLYLIPFLLIFWGYQMYKEKCSVRSWTGLLGTVLCVLCMAVYSSWFSGVYGVRMMSEVSVINEYNILRERDLLELDGVSDAFRNDMANFDAVAEKDYFKEYFYLSATYGLSEMKRVTSQSLKMNYPEYLTKTEKQISVIAKTPLLIHCHEIDTNYFPYRIVKILSFKVKFGFLYVVLWLSLLVYIVKMVTTKKLPCVSLFVWGLVWANYVVILLGAQAEWARLMMPSYPLIFLLTAQLISCVKIDISKVMFR